MRKRNGLFISFVVFFVILFFPQTALPFTDSVDNVGSGQCGRCHESVFRKWQSHPDRKSCESCHGPGRSHVLAPTYRNILKASGTVSGHRKAAPITAAPAKEKLRLELFIMSYCPYGIAALNTLLPLVEKWKGDVDLKLYYIAHRRGAKPEAPPAREDPLPSEKCEAGGALLDGTDAYVSLHGLPEVLEDIRQLVVAHEYPAKLAAYLSARNRNIEEDWKKAARRAGFTEPETRRVEDLSDSRTGDSLFEASMDESEKRGVAGSPTLYINGREYDEAVSPYPVERYFCQESRKRGPCKTFPACGFDFDCAKPGMEGSCKNPMRPDARCVYTKAARFTVTVVNDETCRTCHTGNILMEVLRRFPGADFRFVDLASDSGRLLVAHYGLKTYPAFLFDTSAIRSAKFKAIAHTFVPVKDCYLLRDNVVKSYHYIDRPFRSGELVVFGSFQNPPFIEMVRNLDGTLLDSLRGARVTFNPFMVRRKEESGTANPWYSVYDSPYGADEVRSGINQLCVLSRYPLKRAVAYMVCRGRDVQDRFEGKIPEKPEEWKACALQLKLDTAQVHACQNGTEGRSLLERSLQLQEEIGLVDPAPSFLINNIFRITGYNPAIRKVLLREFTMTINTKP